MKNHSLTLALATVLGAALCSSGCSATGPAASNDAAPKNAPVATASQTETRPFVSFGQSKTHADTPVVSAEQLLADPGAYDGKYLRVTGTVAKVCSKKGCWLALGAAQGDGLMVRFTCPINGRLIPMEAIGKDAVVEGTVKVVEESEAEARHLKEDAGASPAEIAKVVGPQKRVTIAAPAAKVFGLSAS